MCSHRPWLAHCYVLIKQSDSTCPCQFWVCRLLWKMTFTKFPPETCRKPKFLANSWKNPIRHHTHSALRANPFPKVTDLFCRLPWTAVTHLPEAEHLGDLMRLLIRPTENCKKCPFLEQKAKHNMIPKFGACYKSTPFLQQNWFQGRWLCSLAKKTPKKGFVLHWIL